jgi:hypothetical protein
MNLKMNTNVRIILINKLNDNDIGISIRGCGEYELGIFISNVKLNSIAYKMGLKIGGQLLFINNKSLIQLTLDDTFYLSNESILKLKIKKIPI